MRSPEAVPRERTLYRPDYMLDHLVIGVSDLATSRALDEAALAAGGRDNDAPGLRPRYSGDFALDPDGDNAEAVCHTPG
jgi:hypothetical protein